MAVRSAVNSALSHVHVWKNSLKKRARFCYTQEVFYTSYAVS